MSKKRDNKRKVEIKGYDIVAISAFFSNGH